MTVAESLPAAASLFPACHAPTIIMLAMFCVHVSLLPPLQLPIIQIKLEGGGTEQPPLPHARLPATPAMPAASSQEVLLPAQPPPPPPPDDEERVREGCPAWPSLAACLRCCLPSFHHCLLPMLLSMLLLPVTATGLLAVTHMPTGSRHSTSYTCYVFIATCHTGPKSPLDGVQKVVQCSVCSFLVCVV